MLKSIGIEKGKKFDPDRRTQAILNDAIGEARAWLDNRYEGVFTTSFNEGQQWVLPAVPGVSEGMMTNFAEPGCLSGGGARRRLFDGLFQRQAPRRRAVLPDDDPRQGPQAAGRQRHVPAERAGECAGETLLVCDGLRSRHARADPWQAMVQPLVEHAEAAEERRRIGGCVLRAESAARKGVELGSDDAKGRFEVLFRLYGPQKPFFDKKWVLPDIETDRSAVRMEVAMKYLLIQMCAGLLMAASVVNVHAQPAGTAVPVTVDNFKRAETDMYLAGFVKEGAFRKFFHHRDLPVENTGVRPNRDTLYSYAVFDLDAGPVTVALPDAGNSRKHARTSAISRSGRTAISICSATSPRRSRGSAISRRAAALPRSPRHGGSATSTASPRAFRSRRTAAPLSR